jgi:Transposase domain (DUF772)
VMVLQALEGLSDREAVARLETDIRWKVAAGLSLMDEAFHSTVLVLWRNKLRESEGVSGSLCKGDPPSRSWGLKALGQEDHLS